MGSTAVFWDIAHSITHMHKAHLTFYVYILLAFLVSRWNERFGTDNHWIGGSLTKALSPQKYCRYGFSIICSAQARSLPCSSSLKNKAANTNLTLFSIFNMNYQYVINYLASPKYTKPAGVLPACTVCPAMNDGTGKTASMTNRCEPFVGVHLDKSGTGFLGNIDVNSCKEWSRVLGVPSCSKRSIDSSEEMRSLLNAWLDKVSYRNLVVLSDSSCEGWQVSYLALSLV